MIRKISLVFGSTGQDGALLSLSLLKQNYVVIGTSRKIQTHGFPEIANHVSLGIEKDIKLENCDPENFKQVKDIIEKYKPNEIYNLAAQSSVGRSYNDPQKTLKSIVDVTLNILEVCRHIKYVGRIFFAAIVMLIYCWIRKISIEAFGENWLWYATIGFVNLVLPFFLCQTQYYLVVFEKKFF